MTGEGMLSWRRYRYGKLAMWLAVLSIAVYASQTFDAAQPANGGTWQGYTLGGFGVLLIIWLSLLGIRKRSYASTLGSVQGWTSAHVWLGVLLVLVATLHSSGQLGWNVHTLAYVLLCLVVVTGIFGVLAYYYVPSRIAGDHSGQSPDTWLAELGSLDSQIREVARGCEAQSQALVLSSLDMTRLGGGLLQQLSGRDRSRVKTAQGDRPIANPDQAVVLRALAERVPVAEKKEESAVMNELLSLFGRRQVLLQQLRKQIQADGVLKIWLYFHVPLTLVLLAALAVHIVTVFLYW